MAESTTASTTANTTTIIATNNCMYHIGDCAICTDAVNTIGYVI